MNAEVLLLTCTVLKTHHRKQLYDNIIYSGEINATKQVQCVPLRRLMKW